ncbi:hypothetical protein B14911_06998 [Bacillus sp. NRRL B-14911]|nr:MULTISPECIES: hypothetical protein [Bacillus]EAR64536.1 hypothetical protein B14911_06998 [Bacillus sp. NRRL B-14911]
MMREPAGTCVQCGKTIYCLDGFFNGIITDDKKAICFECSEEG